MKYTYDLLTTPQEFSVIYMPSAFTFFMCFKFQRTYADTQRRTGIYLKGRQQEAKQRPGRYLTHGESTGEPFQQLFPKRAHGQHNLSGLYPLFRKPGCCQTHSLTWDSLVRWPVLQDLKPEDLCVSLFIAQEVRVMFCCGPLSYIHKSGIPGKPLSEGYLEEGIISYVQIAASNTMTAEKSFHKCSYY